MPDWSYLRQRARAVRKRLCEAAQLDPAALVPAETILYAALADTGLHTEKLPADDSLLGGGYAALYRETETLFYRGDEGVRPERMRVIRAHEFGHFYLHPDVTHDSYTTEEADSLLSPPESRSYSAEIAEGYSRTERREREADTFAAELLLPAPALRRAFIDEGKGSYSIVEEVGVSERAVLSQLVHAILEPEPPAETLAHTPDETPIVTLDASQQAAAETNACPILIDAGPGTGKTRTLIARIISLIEKRGVAPENILALTFSNNAAEEIRARLQKVLGEPAERVWIGTFHAFGYEILKKDGAAIGLPTAPALLEPADAIAFLERHLDLLKLDRLEFLHNPAFALPAILDCIARAKNELITPSQYSDAAQFGLENAKPDEVEDTIKTAETAIVYEVYQKLLESLGKLDFGDLLMRAVALLEDYADVRQRWQTQYPHIVADEYQDVNRASARLLKALAGEGRGLWAVGDSRQAIYKFMGASPENMRRFEEDFAGASRLRLKVNYRSRTPVVELFGAATRSLFEEKPPDTTHRKLWHAQRGAGEHTSIIIAEADDEQSQADGIAQHIRQWIERGVPAHEQAVLCRTNRHCARIAELLSAREIPAQHLGNLFDREEVRDMLALLSLVTEPDGMALVRVANFPQYRIPQKDVETFIAENRAAHIPFPQALNQWDKYTTVSGDGIIALSRLWIDIGRLAERRSDAYTFLTRYLFEFSNYLRPLLENDTFQNRQKRLAISRLLAFTQGLTDRIVASDGEDMRHLFLTHLRALLASDGERTVRLPALSAREGVAILTAHGAKGLEFPVVYLPNLLKSHYPMGNRGSMVKPPASLASGNSDAETEIDREEECLFFVALSRPREQIVLSYPKTRGAKGVTVSPYLTALRAEAQDIGATLEQWTMPQQEAKIPIEDEETPEVPALKMDNTEKYSTVSQLETYRRCPRRYYYRYIKRLPTQNETSDYLTFHSCLDAALQAIHSAQIAGNPLTERDALDVFVTQWRREIIGETTPHRQILQTRAATMIRAAVNDTPEGTPLGKQHYTANLGYGRVRVTGDQVTENGDSLEITTYHRRRLKPDDHTDPELALLRRAAQETTDKPVELRIVSLLNGEAREVKYNKAYEPKRVEKYTQALSGIRAGNFTATPDERECAVCPFFVVCPIG